ncbi:MAG: hypothetical protein QOG27_727, partial [Verrucomicrobiota bacterium]
MKLGLARTLTNKDKATVEQERSNGAVVVVAAIPNGWTKPFKLVMNDIWKDLALQGVNYFTFGGPRGARSYSSRADFRSSRYQAWMGVYAVDARKNVFGRDNALINRSPALFIRDLARLAEHDQKGWLRSAGDPSPEAKSTRFRQAGTLRIDGADRAVFEATMESHSDLALSEKGVASLLGRPKPGYWTSHLKEYHKVTLHGLYVPWYAPRSQTVFVAYANGAAFQTTSGESIDYAPALRAEMRSMLEGVRVQEKAR